MTNKTSTASLGSVPAYKKPTEAQQEKHVPSIFPSLKHIERNIETETVTLTVTNSSNNIYSEHINPKSIIHKFELLVKNNGREEAVDMVSENNGIPKSNSCTTNISSATDPNRCSGSLTYISSVISETSPRDFNDNEEDDDVQAIDSEEEDENEETYQGNHTDTDELYEELGSGNTMARKDQVNIGD